MVIVLFVYWQMIFYYSISSHPKIAKKPLELQAKSPAEAGPAYSLYGHIS